MNANAQNAFLKTLEEPPDKCLFVLTTGRPGALLPTIRSRCQILSLTDNSCTYDFSIFPGLLEVLKKLACDSANDLVSAEDCAVQLIKILNSLDDLAKAHIDEKWKPRLEAAGQLESAGLKLLEKRRDGATARSAANTDGCGNSLSVYFTRFLRRSPCFPVE